MSYIPHFIVVEGLDGSGKSTQIEMLRDRFQAGGDPCHITAEPTDFPTGKFLRSVLRGEVKVDQRTAAALFAADRIEHIHHPERGLIAELAKGKHVISSRYYFSSFAYQADQADPSWIALLNSHAKGILSADLTIFLDLDPTVSMQRLRLRGGQAELYETEAKLMEVRESFKLAFKYFGEGENIVVIDANRDPVAVAEDIWAAVMKLD